MVWFCLTLILQLKNRGLNVLFMYHNKCFPHFHISLLHHVSISVITITEHRLKSLCSCPPCSVSPTPELPSLFALVFAFIPFLELLLPSECLELQLLYLFQTSQSHSVPLFYFQQDYLINCNVRSSCWDNSLMTQVK